MTVKQIETRGDRADMLRVFEISEGQYYVESSQGHVCYKVSLNGTKTCACEDFAINAPKDPNFICKHIIATTNGNGQKFDLHEKGKMKLDKSCIVTIKGKDFVIYEGLLDLAHQIGMKKSYAIPVQYPTKENGMTAICQSYIETDDGKVFIEIGDASPDNVKRDVAAHIIRMAATRAKARALRDMTNIGLTCSVELAESDTFSGITEKDEDSSQRKSPKKETKTEEKKETPRESIKAPASLELKAETSVIKREATTQKVTDVPSKKRTLETKSSEGDIPKISIAQRNAVENLAKRRGLSQDAVKELAVKQFNKELDAITTGEASTFIRFLQSAA